MAAQSMAADRNREEDPMFIHAMLQQCYSMPEKLIEFNTKKFGDSREEAKVHVETLCGRLLMNAKPNGVGVILLNMYESPRINM